MQSKISRRSALATTGRAAVAVFAGGGLAVSAVTHDPIIPIVEEYRRAARSTLDLYGELDEAEAEARQRSGEGRPTPLIHWRDYFIGDGEIDQMHERLLRDWSKGDPTLTILVEAEYEDAKERYQAQLDGGVAWDARNGLTEMREQMELAEDERLAAIAGLIETTPITVGGCAALVGVVAEELDGGEMEWFEPALANAAQALRILAGGVDG